MTDKNTAYRTSKSGKRLTIQYGHDWYEEHDTTKYIVWRELLNSVPKYVIENNVRVVDSNGDLVRNPDYKQPQNAYATLAIAIREPRFGPCIEIQCMVKIGSGAEREHTTYLLTKYQALYIASRLSPSHAHLVLSHFYASLTDDEKNMHASDFIRMIGSRADTVMTKAAHAESVEEASSRLDCLLTLEQAIEAQQSGEDDYAEFGASMSLATELATQQVVDFQQQVSDKTTPVELVDYVDDRLSAAITVRDAMVAMLESNIQPSLVEAGERIAKLRVLLPIANSALEVLGILADKVKDPEQRASMQYFSEHPFRDVSFNIDMSIERQAKILYWMDKNKIDARDPANKSWCRPDFLAHGIYAVMLQSRMARTDDYNKLLAAYQKQYKYTAKQMEYIRTTFESLIVFPRRSAGLLIVEQHSKFKYGVYCIVNQ